jgi:hypothetical protein
MVDESAIHWQGGAGEEPERAKRTGRDGTFRRAPPAIVSATISSDLLTQDLH